MAEHVPPYWIDGSDEHCTACSHPHSHRAGHRCAACDRNFCVICITNENGELVCEPCSDEIRKKQKKQLKKHAKAMGKAAKKAAKSARARGRA